MRKIIASIDIGTESIKLVVGEISNKGIHVLASSSVPSAGIKRGFVVDPESLLPKLEEAFKKCNSMLGMKVDKVILCIPNDNAEFFLGEGSTTITNDEHLMKQSDVIHAMQACTYNRIEDDREIVSLRPTSYIVDDEHTVKDPIGLEANKLTVKALATTIPRKNAYSLVKCLETIGVKVIDFSLGVIGDYYEFQKEMMKDTVGSIINIGYQRTTVSIFNKGLLTNTDVLDLGSNTMIHDIAYIYKLNKNDAIDVVNTLCKAHKGDANPSVSKSYTTKTGEKVTISEFEATEVVSSRLEEILKLAKKQINLLTKKEIHYIMITGGVSEMPDFSLLVEEIFGHNAKVGNMKELGVRNNIYSASIGLIKYYEEKMNNRNQEFSIFSEEEMEELSSVPKKSNFGENSVLGKLFGYFFND